MAEDQHDAHVALATKTFRDSGFSLAAMQWKRSAAEVEALRQFNGAPAGWAHPFAWRYFPNPAMRDQWQRMLAGSLAA